MELLSLSEVLRSVRVNEGVCAQECAQHPFWSRAKVGSADECWPWIGCKDRDGYGRYRLDGSRWRAHRFALALTHGTAVVDLVVRHSCDNPSCVNPNHLVPGTQLENIQDRDERGRQAKGTGNGRAKLTEDVVRAIRAAYKPHKVTVNKLSALFGISRWVVADIVRRITWRHVQ